MILLLSRVNLPNRFQKQTVKMREKMMDELVYPRERVLGKITLVLGIVAWLLILVGTLGLALIYVLLGFIAYVFAQSAWVAAVRGTAVQITEEQFPDLHARFKDCCEKLHIGVVPEAYLLNGNGIFNAFATRFFGRNFVILYSDVVDTFEVEPDSINFYIGHELGHIRLKHLTGQLWRLPMMWLPLLGAAYSRAKEYSCDLHGRACCESAETAARALIVLGAGPIRVKTTDIHAYTQQVVNAAGFWSSFHEIVNGYPWLTKRVWRIRTPDRTLPKRNPFAYFLGLFVPYGGAAGGGSGFLILVAILGVMAAVALPAYQEYTNKAVVSQAWIQSAPTRNQLAAFYGQHQKVPTFREAGLEETLPDGRRMGINSESMIVDVPTKAGTLLLVPKVAPDEVNGIAWTCEAGEGMKPAALPLACSN